jgi:hypothetical protein
MEFFHILVLGLRNRVSCKKARDSNVDRKKMRADGKTKVIKVICKQCKSQIRISPANCSANTTRGVWPGRNSLSFRRWSVSSSLYSIKIPAQIILDAKNAILPLPTFHQTALSYIFLFNSYQIKIY